MTDADVTCPTAKRPCTDKSIYSTDHSVFGIPELLELIAYYAIRSGSTFCKPRHGRRINVIRLFKHRQICRAWRNSIDASVQIWRDNWNDQQHIIDNMCGICIPNEFGIICPRDKNHHRCILACDEPTITNRFLYIGNLTQRRLNPTTYMRVVDFFDRQCSEPGRWHRCEECDEPLWFPGTHTLSHYTKYTCDDCETRDGSDSSD